jgi:hypothetical protein
MTKRLTSDHARVDKRNEPPFVFIRVISWIVFCLPAQTIHEMTRTDTKLTPVGAFVLLTTIDSNG